jgi:hypothetical protein
MLLWQRKQKPLKQEFGDPDIIYIVELKVCCDSSPEQTYQRALDQHDNLQRAICRQHPDAIVYTVVILVGVAGTAYEDFTLAPLRRLGIRGNHLKQTTQKLAVCATQHMQKIWQHRQKLQQGTAAANTRVGIG